jgi:hypothetical protein
MAQLTRIEASLAPLVETCSRQGPRETCPIFAALSHQANDPTDDADSSSPSSAVHEHCAGR